MADRVYDCMKIASMLVSSPFLITIAFPHLVKLSEKMDLIYSKCITSFLGIFICKCDSIGGLKQITSHNLGIIPEARQSGLESEIEWIIA